MFVEGMSTGRTAEDKRRTAVEDKRRVEGTAGNSN